MRLFATTLTGMETPSEATIVCTSAMFTFKLNEAITDNGSIYPIIQASGDQFTNHDSVQTCQPPQPR